MCNEVTVEDFPPQRQRHATLRRAKISGNFLTHARAVFSATMYTAGLTWPSLPGCFNMMPPLDTALATLPQLSTQTAPTVS